jgi:hypothetical protein
VLYGSGAPSNGTGVNGNFYVDDTGWNIYGPKASGVWPSGVSIIGPTGSTGATGATGSTGSTGAAGASNLTAVTTVLTDASTVAVNASLGNHFRLTFTSGIGNTRIMGAPSSPTDGQKITFEFIQDGTGSRLVTWNAAYVFGLGLPTPVLTTTANKRDYVGFIYSGSVSAWECVAFANGF